MILLRTNRTIMPVLIRALLQLEVLCYIGTIIFLHPYCKVITL